MNYCKALESNERCLLNLGERLRRWLQLDWKVSWRGNLYLIEEGHEITIFEDKYRVSGFWFCVVETDGETFTDPRSFKSVDEEKLAALAWVAKKLELRELMNLQGDCVLDASPYL